ncbi:MAG: hypothetical protein AABW90_01455, partial [Nanoarchaeota archaeon]
MIKNIFIISSIILITLGFLVVINATDLPNVNPRLCEDFDGGIHLETASFVLASKSILSKPKVLRDVCSGERKKLVDNEGKTFVAYSQIKEGSCDANGKPVANVIDITDGFCKMIQLENTGLPGNNMFGVLSRLTGPTCINTERGVVKDGVLYQNGCEGNNTYVEYSCFDDGRLNRKTDNCSLLNEFGRCTKIGCVGRCSDTDPENDINVFGFVNVDGTANPDVCDDTQTKIKQYTCSQGNLKTVNENNPWTSCGLDRVCIVDGVTGAAKCVDRTAAGEAITLEGLRRIVAALQTRIEALEQRIAALT